jgi:hypothetical protein
MPAFRPILLPIGLNNKASGQTQGWKFLLIGSLMKNGVYKGNYSFLTMQIHLNPS